MFVNSQVSNILAKSEVVNALVGIVERMFPDDGIVLDYVRKSGYPGENLDHTYICLHLQALGAKVRACGHVNLFPDGTFYAHLVECTSTIPVNDHLKRDIVREYPALYAAAE